MVSHLFFYQLGLLGLLWLCCMLHYAWPSGHAADLQRLPKPLPPPRKPPRVPKPFGCRPETDAYHLESLRFP